MSKKFNFLRRLTQLFNKSKAYDGKNVEIANENYFVRAITNNDIKDLLAIEREVYDGELPWTKTAFLVELQVSDPHLYLLIQKEQKTVGFIGCRIFNTEAHITNVAVAKTYQGKGIGSFLIKEMRAFAEANQCDCMTLEVRISNKNAQRVYRQLGFISNAIKPEYYSENNEDALEMILPLKEGKNDASN
ncbi:ribosomal-protein-alanine N-acetyltransferase [Erwinia sp. CPCC 100877]|nr:ribosomal-protein-alanine N-acetyltransferase [Erwinia sp. CPCC 100877]